MKVHINIIKFMTEYLALILLGSNGEDTSDLELD